MIWKLHKYVTKDLIKSGLLAAVAFTLVMTGFAIIEPLRKQGLAAGQVLRLFWYLLPVMMSLTLPIAALLAATMVYGRFSMDNELTACRASGVSVYALLKPALALGGVLALATLLLSNWVAPVMLRRGEEVGKANLQQLIFQNLRSKGHVKFPGGGWKSNQPELAGMDHDDLLDYVHADGVFYCDHGVRRTTPHVTVDSHWEGNVQHHVTHTPDGDLTEAWGREPISDTMHPMEFAIKTVEDIRRYRWLFTDVTYRVDADGLADGRQKCKQVGQRGVNVTAWGTSPLMDLVQHFIGPINFHLMSHDHPEQMHELLELMHADNVRHVSAIAEQTPSDVVVSVENTSTTLISPAQFTKYCLRHLCDYGRAIESAGKMHELHMCGHTKKLLPQIDAIPAASIEAYTSPTVGNTRFVDGRTLAPSKTLIGGTNVNTWLWPVERIEQYIAEELAACEDNRRLVVTTAGVAPPGCSAETFREIGQWMHDADIARRQ